MTFKQSYICDHCGAELNSNSMISITFHSNGYSPCYHFYNKKHLIKYIKDNL